MKYFIFILFLLSVFTKHPSNQKIDKTKNPKFTLSKKMQDLYNNNKKESIDTIKISIINNNKEIKSLITELESINDEGGSALIQMIMPDISIDGKMGKYKDAPNNKFKESTWEENKQKPQYQAGLNLKYSYQKFQNAKKEKNNKKDQKQIFLISKLQARITEVTSETLIALKTAEHLIKNIHEINEYIDALILHLKSEITLSTKFNNPMKANQLQITLLEIYTLYKQIKNKIDLNIETFKKNTGRLPCNLTINLEKSQLDLVQFKKKYIDIQSKIASLDTNMKKRSHNQRGNLDFGALCGVGLHHTPEQAQHETQKLDMHGEIYFSYSIPFHKIINPITNQNKALDFKLSHQIKEITFNANKIIQSFSNGKEQVELNNKMNNLHQQICKDKFTLYKNDGSLKDFADSIYEYLKSLNNVNYEYVQYIVQILFTLEGKNKYTIQNTVSLNNKKPNNKKPNKDNKKPNKDNNKLLHQLIINKQS